MTLERRKFLKKVGSGIAGVGFVSLLPGSLLAATFREDSLPRSTPALQGVSAEAILKFIESVEKQDLGVHSLMVVRNGHVVAEGWWAPYAPELKHTLFSLSKSFTSTAVGLAVAEGKLKLTDKVLTFFPEDKPTDVSPNLEAMRVKDLLTMTTGHEKDTLGPLAEEKSGGWARKFLSLPVERKPGTYFLYNTGASYMLSAIVQKVTGQTVLDYLTPRLFQPLGIVGADWETSPDGVNMGGYGLRVRTEDIAKFGQLYLQKGMWNGKQILPAKWVEEATAYQVPNAETTTPAHEWNQGYGYQFWRSRHNSYRGDGAMGQFCLVLPEHDTVIATTSETSDMQAILNAVWENILPGLKKAPLPQDKTNQQALKQKLASLTLLPAIKNVNSPLIPTISGKTFEVQKNPLGVQTASFAFQNDTCTVSFRGDQEQYQIKCGLKDWVKQESKVPGNPPSFTPVVNPKPAQQEKIAAFGTWTSPDTFVMTWSFIESPHAEVVTCHFKDDTVQMAFTDSVALKAPERKSERPVLAGKMIG